MKRDVYREKLDCPDCEEHEKIREKQELQIETLKQRIDAIMSARRSALVGKILGWVPIAIPVVVVGLGLFGLVKSCEPEISETRLSDGSKGAVVKCSANSVDPNTECLVIQAGKACPDGYTVLEKGHGFMVLSCTKDNEPLKAQYIKR